MSGQWTKIVNPGPKEALSQTPISSGVKIIYELGPQPKRAGAKFLSGRKLPSHNSILGQRQLHSRE